MGFRGSRSRSLCAMLIRTLFHSIRTCGAISGAESGEGQHHAHNEIVCRVNSDGSRESTVRAHHHCAQNEAQARSSARIAYISHGRPPKWVAEMRSAKNQCTGQYCHDARSAPGPYCSEQPESKNDLFDYRRCNCGHDQEVHESECMTRLSVSSHKLNALIVLPPPRKWIHVEII